MYCTIISLIIAAFLIYEPIRVEGFPDARILGILITAVSFFFLFIHLILRALAWQPLQKTENEIAPRLIEMYDKDFIIRITDLLIRIFPLLTLLISSDLLITGLIPKNYLIAIWIILLGFVLDGTHLYINRFQKYLDPFQAVNLFSKAATQSVAEEKEEDLLHWIDGLNEISVKAIHNANASLAIHAVGEIQGVAKNFLEASKSISHTDQDADTKKLGITDKVSYILMFICQGLEQINNRAIDHHYENVSNTIISVLEKIAVYAAQYDITLATFPIHFIGKMASKAQDNDLPDVPVRASFVLTEAANGIINDTNINYTELQEPLMSIINHLDNIAKESFRRDKTLNIDILKQPFNRLKVIFSNPKFMNHVDGPTIIKRLGDIISEWDALDIVLKTMPPMPKINPDENPESEEPQS